MLKDITFGQHFPGDSVVHRLDPRMKIILVIVYIVMIFVLNSLIALSIPFLLAVLTYGISKIPFRVAIKSMKPMIPIILFATVFNIFFVKGDILFQVGFVQVTREGVLLAAVMITRIVCLIVGTSLLTYTTSPIELTDAIESLLSPLKAVKLPVHELAMMMSIALRFIPTLIEETDKIISAQKARGADFESGNFLDRVKAMVPILIPLFVSAFRRADDLSDAMECRCYQGGAGRTRLKQLHYSKLDAIAIVFIALVFTGAVLVNKFYGLV